MPIGPNGEPLPYGPGPMNPGMGGGPGPDMPPPGGQQMPPIEAVVARIQELQAELQQLVALAEQMSGPQQGGNPAQAGIDATNASMGGGLLA